MTGVLKKATEQKFADYASAKYYNNRNGIFGFFMGGEFFYGFK